MEISILLSIALLGWIGILTQKQRIHMLDLCLGFGLLLALAQQTLLASHTGVVLVLGFILSEFILLEVYRYVRHGDLWVVRDRASISAEASIPPL